MSMPPESTPLDRDAGTGQGPFNQPLDPGSRLDHGPRLRRALRFVEPALTGAQVERLAEGLMDLGWMNSYEYATLGEVLGLDLYSNPPGDQDT